MKIETEKIGGLKISLIEVKNNVFVEPPITEENFEDNIENFLQSMNEHKYINAKDLGDNIYAFNFTRKAFENRNWDEINVKARGLFINVNTKEIVSRSYNKFFNINEHYNTKIQRLADNLKFPVYAYDKPNGYLGTVGYNSEKDELVFTSKSDIHAEYATWLKELFYKTFSVEKRETIKKFIKDENVSLVFEVIKVKEDPHIIKYYNDKLVLLDIVYRDIVYKKMNYELVKNFAIMINVEFKELEHVFYNWIDFYNWYRNVIEDWSIEKEGYVIEDSNGFMTKIKLPYYNFWKQMRGLKDKIAGKHEHEVKGCSLYTPLHNQVFFWMKKQDREWLKNNDIITIRDEFYKQKSTASAK